ncbi:NADH:flavin oxidoreductase/NADH oxidase [Panus rudis PR-1116 ss-1]|nr:NADH:flavin oxidoreductase/NADH oxidase [Panus rudis PR-1116 ss-1]
MSPSKLFQPLHFGDVQLQHRIVMAPLTRFRSDINHVVGDIVVEYYSQRSRIPGTLLISEGTFIAARAGGYDNVPALETPEQLAGWEKVTQAVHDNKSFIFAQLWSLGRAADQTVLARDGFPFIAASDIPLNNGRPRFSSGSEVRDAAGSEATSNPRPLTVEEIKEFVQLYATAASNAVNAGFDGVEIHAAGGYLLDQFLQDVSNNRTDEYGGSIENRARFPLEVIDAVVKAVGPGKVGIKLSPWGQFQDMRMKDPIPTFSYLVKKIRELHPDFAYIHVIEPRVSGGIDRIPTEGETNDFLQEIWSPRPYIADGGFTRDSAIELADKQGVLVAFGRHFISNPDLPYRIKNGIALNPYDRSTFYKVLSPVGYTDHPFHEAFHGTM